MITKKRLLYIIGGLLLIIGLFIFSFLVVDKKHNAYSKPDISIQSNKLVNAFATNEKKAAILYTNKLIEVTGTIKKITHLNKKNTVILNSVNGNSGIICELNDSEKLIGLKVGQKILIKGICKGFLEDVILLNCYLETNKANE